jgi:hypothetical protein
MRSSSIINKFNVDTPIGVQVNMRYRFRYTAVKCFSVYKATVGEKDRRINNYNTLVRGDRHIDNKTKLLCLHVKNILSRNSGY